MTRARAPYMAWAKKRPAARIDLAGSNLSACGLEDLPGAREAVELAGESPNGYRPLLEAIAARYGVSAENVATAGGCSGANFLACAALLETGDEALIESPAYDPLPAAVELLGARVRFFERKFEEGYALDPERIAKTVAPQTRLIVISNPHNPSGVLASEASIEGLARVADKLGVPVLVDEVYLETVPGPSVLPAAIRSPLVVSSNSLTKSYGLSSLRCGWTLASAEVTEKIRRARDLVDVSGPIPAERLALEAFRNLERLAERARRLVETNRRIVSEFLSGRSELQWASPAATIAFPRFRDGRDAGPFVERLFSEHGVAVVPGSFFGAPSHFRIAFGGSTEGLGQGLDAVARCLDASLRHLDPGP